MTESKPSLRKQIIVALLDNSSNGGVSTKEMAKYLNANRDTISTEFWKLKKANAIEHVGYERYVLTEIGRQMASEIISGKKPTLDKVAKAPVVEEVVTPTVSEVKEDVTLDPVKAEAFTALYKVIDLLERAIAR